MKGLIEAFWAAFPGYQGDLQSLPYTPKLPKDMIDLSKRDESDWVPWRLIPSRLKAADFAPLEKRTGLAYPEIFKTFFTQYHTLGCSIGYFGDMAASPSNDPLGPLAETLFAYPGSTAKHILSLGLLPFGRETQADAGPLCFDLRKGSRREDPPVTFWDGEHDGTAREIGPRLFSSFGKLLECAAHLMSNSEKPAAALRAFARLDPEGAGGPGAEYWKVNAESAS